MKLLLDTHIWLWYCRNDEKLSSKLAKLIESPKNEIWLSPISVWETLVLAQKRRILLSPDPLSWIRRQLQALEIREAPITNEIAILSRKLEMPHEDPADRFITATAMQLELKLATADKILLGLPWLESVS